MFDYAALEALATVLREGSFERAARRLHVTPSAISQRIKQLEERAGQVHSKRVLHPPPLVGPDVVAEGQGDDPGRGPQQSQDGDVLLGLSHPALAGRDREHHAVHGRAARERIGHEPAVAGHVDERGGAP